MKWAEIPSRNKEMARRWNRGESAEALAEEFGLSPRTVIRYMNGMGYRRPDRRAARNVEIAQARRRKIAQRLREGGPTSRSRTSWVSASDTCVNCFRLRARPGATGCKPCGARPVSRVEEAALKSGVAAGPTPFRLDVRRTRTARGRAELESHEGGARLRHRGPVESLDRGRAPADHRRPVALSAAEAWHASKLWVCAQLHSRQEVPAAPWTRVPRRDHRRLDVLTEGAGRRPSDVTPLGSSGRCARRTSTATYSATVYSATVMPPT